MQGKKFVENAPAGFSDRVWRTPPRHILCFAKPSSETTDSKICC